MNNFSVCLDEKFLSVSLADLSLKNVNRFKLLKNAKNKADTPRL